MQYSKKVHGEQTGKIVIAVLVVWAATALFLAVTGQFDRDIGGLPATLIGGLLLPLALYAMFYQRSAGFRVWVRSLDIRPLILIHGWRMLGLGFVFLGIHGQLSPVFAWPAGIGDAVAAVSATLLGIALYSEKRPGPGYIYAWSAFGLLDFIVAVGLGVLSRPGMGAFDQPLTTAILGQFPLALIPGFVVPFLMLTHLVILTNMKDQMVSVPSVAPAAVNLI